MVTYDEELRAHNERLRAAAAVRPGDDVLDVGCGAGQTTREAARAAAPGRVLGIDISTDALARAHKLTAAEALDNVAYEEGDAQTYPFEAASFDIAISRFGVMFFAEPEAAFANIARALRVGGRIAFLVWQARDDNEWAVAIDEVVGSAWPEGVGPFSLSDRDATTRMLERAGFADVAFEHVDEPMFFGLEVSEAFEWVSGFSDVSQALAAMEPAARDDAVQRLRDVLGAHVRPGHGVTFASRAWLVSARRVGQ
jgi:SAM-dependent methyltransferase